MAATRSSAVAMGGLALDFHLPDVVSGSTISLATFADEKALLLMFLSPHCPYVRHLQFGIAALPKYYAGKRLGIVAISSNDAATYPDDAPKGLRKMARTLGFTFPFCYDESQSVARTYRAVCTPEFFLLDGDRRLVYHGQFDNSRPGSSVPVDGKSLREAIDAVLAGQPVDQEQRPSVGCSIKWKRGNEPTHYINAKA